MCKKALTRIKERIKAVLHISPFSLSTQEMDNVVAVGKIPRSNIGLNIKSYQCVCGNSSRSEETQLPCVYFLTEKRIVTCTKNFLHP